jgi:hypothetical protein
MRVGGKWAIKGVLVAGGTEAGNDKLYSWQGGSFSQAALITEGVAQRMRDFEAGGRDKGAPK